VLKCLIYVLLYQLCLSKSESAVGDQLVLQSSSAYFHNHSDNSYLSLYRNLQFLCSPEIVICQPTECQ